MPRIDPSELESLPLEAFALVEGFQLHDVWLVELDDSAPQTIQELRDRVRQGDRSSLNPVVRGLFGLRSVLGRILRLESAPSGAGGRVLERVPSRLAKASLVRPGTPEGPFTLLYALPSEAAYEIVNATVHAILVVALSHRRFYWATYTKPVGRITSIYMWIIDPFRRRVVYPGLESWFVKIAGKT